MSHAEKLREAIRLHALAVTPVDRLATYLLMVAEVRALADAGNVMSAVKVRARIGGDR